MRKEKLCNYEVLRILCAFAVCVLHVSDAVNSELSKNGGGATTDLCLSVLLNSIFRFAVPCFVMLAGAFALSNPRNSDFKLYYIKIFKRIGIPTIIFSMGYFIFLFCQKVLGVVLNGKDIEGLLIPFIQWIKGAPYYHLWYLYMMIGIYIITPIIIIVKEKLGEKVFTNVSVVFIVLASLSGWTSMHYFYWDIGFQFQYLGYYMLGYVIYIKRDTIRKFRPLAYICAGLLTELAAFVIRINLSHSQITNLDAFSPVSNFSPFVVIASVLIFMGVSSMHIKNRNCILRLSALTFYIYLFQQGVWNVISKIGFSYFHINIVLLICPAAVFFISVILSVGYIKLWNRFEVDNRLTNKFLRIFKLEK